ncbi:hypothetical protein LOTGIDRAFT_234276 [Lottia gigantea]|uniref:Nephrocystin-3 n=1 Tax=Lottia gigantea TaxID=225164 RepID=V4A824_LOTGI|nr:hypothetical protein LOTGIDRAFT_234276 [Lottia gigantea]ESO89421.1 hypothetical protein LOTGIDRAFT_234276 [Lottia gigantea]
MTKSISQKRNSKSQHTGNILVTANEIFTCGSISTISGCIYRITGDITCVFIAFIRDQGVTEEMTKYQLKDPKTCRIFLSSPFRGMEPERKEWMSKYVPQLDYLCRSHGVGLVIVDMRWGITEESTEKAQTVNICLREIDRTDIFIGIYAQRYGWHGENDKDLQRNINNASDRYPWIKHHRNASVTAIEYLHGHLNKPGDLPACFAFRDKSYDDIQKKALIKAKESKVATNYISESPEAAADLEKIKTKVIGSKDKCLAVFDDYKTPAEGIEKIFEVVKKYLETELLVQTEKLSAREQKLEQHDAFIAHHSSSYISDGRIVQSLEHRLTGSHSPLLITGPSGSGKSSLLCYWLSQLKSSNTKKVAYIYHFIGCGEDGSTVSALLNRLYLELVHALDPSKTENVRSLQDLLNHKKESDDIKDVVRKCSAKIEELSSKKRIVLVLDGLDHVELSSKTAKCLYWLPHVFPSNTTVIVSCTTESDDVIHELRDVRQYDVLELKPLDKKHRQEICVQTLKKHGKELKDSQLEKIVSCPQTQIPIFLRTLLTELRMFGEFRKLDAKIDSLIKAKSAKELFQQLLIRLEEEFGGNKKHGNLVEKVLCCICLSNQGLSETELIAILNITSHVWSPLYFSLNKFLVENGGLLRLEVSELLEAVTDRYLKDPKTRNMYLQKLIKYFEGLVGQYTLTMNVIDPLTKRPADELPELYKLANDKKGLVKTLTNMVTFGRLFLEREYDLLEYWKWIGYHGDEISQLYIKATEQKYSELKKQKNLTSPPELGILSYLDALTYVMEVGHFNTGLQTILDKRLQFLKMKDLDIDTERKTKMMDDVKQKLAILYINTGRLEEAQVLQTDVLEERKRIVDEQVKGVKVEDLKSLGTAYHSLALLNTKLGQKQEALQNFNKALNIHQQSGNRLEVADSLHNIGVILMDRQSFEQALKYCLQSLQIYEEEYFGHLPPAIGVMTGNIAVCYRNLGRQEESEKMYIKSRAIAERALGYYHPNVAHTILNHGTLCLNSGNFKDAERLFMETLEILQKCEEGKKSTTSFKTKEKLCLSQLKQNKKQEAFQLFDSLHKTLVKKKCVDDCFVPLYTLIVEELIQSENYQKALDVTMLILNSNQKQDSNFKHLNMISKHVEVDDKTLHKFSIDEGFKLFPGSFPLFRYSTETDLIPNEKYSELIKRLDQVYDNSNLKEGLYETTMVWCQKQGKSDGVFTICKHASEKFPENTTFLTQLTQVLHEQEKYSEALPYAIKLATKCPDKPDVILITGEIAARVEDLPLAKKYFQKILDEFSDNKAICEQAKSGLRVVNLLAKKV